MTVSMGDDAVSMTQQALDRGRDDDPDTGDMPVDTGQDDPGENVHGYGGN